MDKDSLERLLKEANGFEEVFRAVKRVVKSRLGIRRAGLMLILGDAPEYVLAYHAIGSNAIVINREVLEHVKASSKSREELNSYLFVVLLHEYLHSLGYTDEASVRFLVRRLIKELLGEEHVAYKIASGSLNELFTSRDKTHTRAPVREFEIVKDFDRDEVTYIG